MNSTRRNLLHIGAFTGFAALTNFGRIGMLNAASLADVKARGYMLVATEDDYKPFEFIENGKPTGFTNDMLDLFRKVASVQIRQEVIPWTGLLPGVSTGKYDAAVTAVLITNERERFLDFCSPVAEATNYYVTRKSDRSITTIKDLSGKKCGVQAGSEMLNSLPELEAMLKQSNGRMGEVVQYVSYPEAYQDLAIGRTDYVVNTVINLQSLLKDKPNLFAMGQPVSRKFYIAWAVRKGNTEMRALLNDFLLAQRRNGEMTRLQTKWFGKSFDDMPETYMTPA